MSQPQRSLRGFTNSRKRFRKDIGQLRPIGDLLTKITRPLLESLVGKGLGHRLEGVDSLDKSLVGPNLSVINRTKKFLGDPEHSRLPAVSPPRRSRCAMLETRPGCRAPVRV